MTSKKSHFTCLIFFIFQMLILTTPILSVIPSAYTLPCCCDDEPLSSSSDHIIITSWFLDILITDSNINLLTSDELQVVYEIYNRMLTTNKLDSNDIVKLCQLKDIVLRDRFSQLELEDFNMLITKKINNVSLSTEEIVRLNEYINLVK